MIKQQEINYEEALHRARNSKPGANWLTVMEEFSKRGIPQADIKPTVNVLTYHAWRAVGRQVRKGERGVRITTWIPYRKRIEDAETGEDRIEERRRPKAAYVFHVSQTDPIEDA